MDDPAALVHAVLTPRRPDVLTPDQLDPPEQLGFFAILRLLRDRYGMTWYCLVSNQERPAQLHVIQGESHPDSATYRFAVTGPPAGYRPVHALEEP